MDDGNPPPLTERERAAIEKIREQMFENYARRLAALRRRKGTA